MAESMFLYDVSTLKRRVFVFGLVIPAAAMQIASHEVRSNDVPVWSLRRSLRALDRRLLNERIAGRGGGWTFFMELDGQLRAMMFSDRQLHLWSLLTLIFAA